MFKTLGHKDELLQLPESAILLEALLDTVVFGGFRREVPERNTITFCQDYFAMTHKYDAIWAHQAIGAILRKHGRLSSQGSGEPGFDWFFLACQLKDEMAMRTIMATPYVNSCTLGHSYCKLHPFSHTNSSFVDRVGVDIFLRLSRAAAESSQVYGKELDWRAIAEAYF